MITWENYEEYMVMHADGELTKAQEQELMSFLYEHPGLQAELTAFTMTRMVPDATETYNRKESLMRPAAAEQPKVIAIPVWRRYAVAAGVAALLMAAAYKWMAPGGGDAGAIAQNGTAPVNNTSVATVENTTRPAAPAAAQDLHAAVQPQEKPQQVVAAVPASKNEQPLAAVKITGKDGDKPALAGRHDHRHDAALTAAVPARDEMKPLPLTGLEEIKNTQKNVAAAVTNVPALAINYGEQDAEDDASGALIDRLPISDTKKTGMKSFASEVAMGYSKVSTIRQEIAKSNVSVKLGNKQLILSF